MLVFWTIWLAKPGIQGGRRVQVFAQVVTCASSHVSHFGQRCIDISINGISEGYCNPYFEGGGMSTTLSMELMFNPIVIAFLLRDTRFEALLFAWLTAVGVLVAFCAVLETPDLIVATLGYVFFSTERHRRALHAVLRDLKQALLDNEQLSCAAQALELKAMIRQRRP